MALRLSNSRHSGAAAPLGAKFRRRSLPASPERNSAAARVRNKRQVNFPDDRPPLKSTREFAPDFRRPSGSSH
jgi:hypothetical protein